MYKPKTIWCLVSKIYNESENSRLQIWQQKVKKVFFFLIVGMKYVKAVWSNETIGCATHINKNSYCE